MLNIGDLSRLNGKRYPEKPALVDGDHSLTYAELDRASNQLGNALAAQGVVRGDRVAILSYNRIEYAIATQAVAKIGAILVPINFRLRPAELTHILTNSEASVLILEDRFHEQVEDALRSAPVRPTMVWLDRQGPGSLGEILATASDEDPGVVVDESEPCVIMYTSGTTGAPKGVVVAHRTYLRMYYAQALEAGLAFEDVHLLAAPMFHAAGMNLALHQCLFMGSTGVVHRGAFDPPVIMDVVMRHRISVAVMIPTTIMILAGHPAVEGFDGSSLRRVYYGGMPCTPEVQAAARRIFPNAGLVQIYGSTETGMATVLRASDHADYWRYTGREALLSEVRVVDENARDVPQGGVGEVITRQAMLGMLEYWRNPEATAETVRNGWIHSGDLARVEPNGFISIVDRIKDVIISGGENVYPKEVETVLLAHPAITDAAAFGVPHPIYGEAVVAAVVSSGGPIDVAEVLASCRSELASYKIPKALFVLDVLPRNSSDKIQKHILRDQFRDVSVGTAP